MYEYIQYSLLIILVTYCTAVLVLNILVQAQYFYIYNTCRLM